MGGPLPPLELGPLVEGAAAVLPAGGGGGEAAPELPGGGGEAVPVLLAGGGGEDAVGSALAGGGGDAVESGGGGGGDAVTSGGGGEGMGPSTGDVKSDEWAGHALYKLEAGLRGQDIAEASYMCTSPMWQRFSDRINCHWSEFVFCPLA